MEELRIGRTAFYSYKRKIFKLFGDIAAKKSQESLEFEAEVLKDRLVRLHRVLEVGISQPNAALSEKAQAAAVAAEIAINAFRLEVEGLKARQGRPIQVAEQKAIRYIGTVSGQLSESNPDYTPTEEDDEDTQDPAGESTSSAGESNSKVF